MGVDVAAAKLPLPTVAQSSEQTQQLHTRISAESNAKESLKMETATIRRIVELHIRQLFALCNQPHSADAFHRFTASVKQFDGEISDKCLLTEADMRALKGLEEGLSGAGGTAPWEG